MFVLSLLTENNAYNKNNKNYIYID